MKYKSSTSPDWGVDLGRVSRIVPGFCGALVRMLCVLLLSAWMGPAVAWEFEGVLSYDSRYIGAGNTNELTHGGIGTLELGLEKETEWGRFSHGIELILATSVNYKESVLSVGYGRDIGAFDLSLSYAHLEFDGDAGEDGAEDKEGDNEWAAELSWTGWEAVTPNLEYLYSDNAKGGLLTFTLEGEIEIAGQSLSPYLLIDFDYDYVSPEYEGLNSIGGGVAWSMPLGNHLEMTVHLSYANAQRNLRLAGEDRDYFWGGVSFSL